MKKITVSLSLCLIIALVYILLIHYEYSTHCSQHTFQDSMRTCLPCDIENATEVLSSNECLRCPNRVYISGNCVLKNCPNGTFRGDGGSCISCTREQPVSVSEKSECLICSNREIVELENGITSCASKCEGKCRDVSLVCYECGDCFHPTAYVVSEEECLKCSNRHIKDGLCVSKTKCPQGMFLSPTEDICEPLGIE